MGSTITGNKLLLEELVPFLKSGQSSLPRREAKKSKISSPESIPIQLNTFY